MKRTKENELKVLEGMKEHAWKMVRSMEENGESQKEIERQIGYASALESAIWVLTRKSYFEDMADIFAN